MKLLNLIVGLLLILFYNLKIDLQQNMQESGENLNNRHKLSLGQDRSPNHSFYSVEHMIKSPKMPSHGGSPMRNTKIIGNLKPGQRQENANLQQNVNDQMASKDRHLKELRARKQDSGTQIDLSEKESREGTLLGKKAVAVRELDASPTTKKKMQQLQLPYMGANKHRGIRDSQGAIPQQLPEVNLEVQGARFGHQPSSALGRSQALWQLSQETSIQQSSFLPGDRAANMSREPLMQRADDQAVADLSRTHDSAHETKKFSNLASSKRHVYLRELDPHIELKSTNALAPLVMSYRPNQAPSKDPLDQEAGDPDRADARPKLSPITSTHYEDKSKRKKTTGPLESQRDSKNATNYQTWMLRNTFATQKLSQGAFSVRDSSQFAEPKHRMLHKKNRMSMNAPDLGVPMQYKYNVLPSKCTRKKDPTMVEGMNVRQLVSQQIDRCKLLGRTQVRSRPRGGNQGTEGVEDIIKKRNLVSPQTDKVMGQHSQRDSERQRESVQGGQAMDVREPNLSPHFQAPSDRISSMDHNVYPPLHSQFDKFEEMQKVNDKIFRVNMMKKFPNAKVTKDFFKSRHVETRARGAHEVNTARAALSVREADHENRSQDNKRAIQIIGVHDGDSNEGYEEMKARNEPYYLNLVKLKNAKDRDDYNKKFRSARQGDSECQTTEPDESVQIGPVNQSLFNSVASKESVQQNLTPIEETFNSGLLHESIDSLQQASKISYQKEKKLLQAFADMEGWNMRLDEDVKDLINVAGANMADKKQSVLDYFAQRNKDIEGIFKTFLPKRSLERKYGVPPTIEALLHLIFETMQTAAKKLMNFFTREKIVQNFQAQIGQKRLQDLIDTVEKFKQKEKEEREFGKSLERVEGIRQLLEEYEQYGQIDHEKMELDDELASGCQGVLEVAYRDLNRQRGDVRGGNELDVQALPFDKIEVLMSKKTTMIQKRTAFKVLQRHFRKDPEVADAETQYNFYEDLLGDMAGLQEYINELKQKLADMEDEDRKLRAQIDDLHGKLGAKNKEIDQLKHDVMLASQTIGETKIEIVELGHKMEKYKELVIEKERIILVKEEEQEKEASKQSENKDLIKQLEAQIAAKTKEADELALERSSLRDRIKELEEEIAALTASAQREGGQVAMLRDEVERLKQALEEAERRAAAADLRAQNAAKDAAKKRPATPPPVEVEVRVPVEVPRPLVGLGEQCLDLQYLQVESTPKPVAKAEEPPVEEAEAVEERVVRMASRAMQTSPWQVEAKDPEPEGYPSIDAHTQTLAVMPKAQSQASTQTIPPPEPSISEGSQIEIRVTRPLAAGKAAQTQTDRIEAEKPAAVDPVPKIITKVSPKEKLLPPPSAPMPAPPKPETVDRASSALNLWSPPEPEVPQARSKGSSALGFAGQESQEQQAIIQDYLGDKNPLTNLEVQRKVTESKDCAVQVSLVLEPARFEQFAVLPQPPPERSASPPRVAAKRDAGPPIYGFAYGSLQAGASLQAISSDGSPPRVYRREDGSLPRPLVAPVLQKQQRALKKGRLIIGTTRALKDTRDKSHDDDPLAIDLTNQIPRKTTGADRPSPRRGSTESPARKDPTAKEQYYNQMFELSRVITNSKAQPEQSTEGLAASSRASVGRPNLGTLPDDSLFDPSQAQEPIKVLESETKRLWHHMNADSFHSVESQLPPVTSETTRNQQPSRNRNQDLEAVRRSAVISDRPQPK